MPYFDCYLAPVPRANKAAYEELARIAERVLREHGATRVVDSWLDDGGPQAESYHGSTVRLASDQYPSLVQAVGVYAGETVAMSWVEWPDKAARDAGMEKVTGDPRMQFDDRPAAFDGRRLLAAGFVPMLPMDAA
ncbi:MAG: DUF1428 domain-containing protein [Rhodoferax sp.]|nr:DUF1428 domain-containing protein [Rhodoferax sp.]